MEKKDLITVRDYTYDVEVDSLGYESARYISAKDYVNGILEQLKMKKERLSSFITVDQFARELKLSQYGEEEKSKLEKIDDYMLNAKDALRVMG